MDVKKLSSKKFILYTIKSSGADSNCLHLSISLKVSNSQIAFLRNSVPKKPFNSNMQTN